MAEHRTKDLANQIKSIKNPAHLAGFFIMQVRHLVGAEDYLKLLVFQDVFLA